MEKRTVTFFVLWVAATLEGYPWGESPTWKVMVPMWQTGSKYSSLSVFLIPAEPSIITSKFYYFHLGLEQQGPSTQNIRMTLILDALSTFNAEGTRTPNIHQHVHITQSTTHGYSDSALSGLRAFFCPVCWDVLYQQSSGYHRGLDLNCHPGKMLLISCNVAQCRRRMVSWGLARGICLLFCFARRWQGSGRLWGKETW